MADVEQQKGFKPIGKLWLHIKVLYFLLCFLILLSVALLLLLRTNQINLDKYESGLCNPLSLRHKTSELFRLKRHLAEAKTAEDLGTKRNARRGMKSRNETPQSNGDWVWMSSFSRIPVSCNLYRCVWI